MWRCLAGITHVLLACFLQNTANATSCHAEGESDSTAGTLPISVSVSDPAPNAQLLITPATPTPSDRVELPDNARDLAVSDTTVYVAAGAAGVVAIDTAATGQTQIVARHRLGSEVSHIAIYRGRAYVATGDNTITVLDIGDEHGLRPIQSLEFDGRINSLYAAPDGLYVLVDGHSIVVVQAGADGRAELVSTFEAPGEISDLTAHDNTLYLAALDAGILAVDSRDKRALRLLGRYSTVAPALSVDVDRGTVIAALDDAGIVLLGHTAASGFTWLGSHGNLGHVLRVTQASGRALALNEDGAAYVLDISDPTAPSVAHAWRAEASEARWLGDRTLLTLRGNTLERLELDTPPPQWTNEALDVGQGVNFGGERRLAIVDGLAYVADWFSGLHIFDIHDPYRPRLLSSYRTPGSAKGIVVRDGLAFVADDDHGLQVIDVTDPRRPRAVAQLSTPGLAYTPVLDGTRLYLASHHGGFQIIDVTDPRRPRLLGGMDTEGKAWSIAVQGNTVYVADDRTGLRIFEVSDPAAPRELGRFSPGDNAEDVRVEGDTVYVAFFGSGVFALDVHDPAQPRVIAHRLTPGNARGLYLHGNQLLVADWYAGVRILDTTPGAMLSPMGQFDTPGAAWGVSGYLDRYAVVADWWGGLLVLDVGDPRRPRLASRYHGVTHTGHAAARDGRLMIAHDDRGVQIYDINNPMNPTWLDAIEDAAHARALAWYKDTALIADPTQGLLQASQSTKNRGASIRTLSALTGIDRLLVHGDLAYLARTQARSISLLDLATIGTNGPRIIATISADARDLSATDERLYIATDRGVAIFDVTEPVRPRSVGLFEHPGGIGRMLSHVDELVASDTRGRILALARQGDSLVVRDTLALGDDILDLALAGDTLFVLGGNHGVVVLNASPGQPLRVEARVPLLASATRLTADAETAYATGSALPVAIERPPRVHVLSRTAAKSELSIDGPLAPGRYGVELLAADGRWTRCSGGAVVRAPSRNKPPLSTEAFQKLLKAYRNSADP